MAQIPFTPTDISGLVVWLAADKITGLNDGDAITTWTDSSGNGNDASQASSTLKPLYKTNIVNGKPVVRFDGTDDYMTIVDNASYKVTNPTIFFVAKQTTTQFSQTVNYPHTSTHTSPWFRWCFLINTSNQLGFHWNGNGGTTASKTIALNSFQIYEGLDGSSYVDNVNFTAVADADITYPNATGIHIGSIITGGEYFIGDMAEILIYNTSLSAANRTKIRNYLDLKWMSHTGLSGGSNLRPKIFTPGIAR